MWCGSANSRGRRVGETLLLFYKLVGFKFLPDEVELVKSVRSETGASKQNPEGVGWEVIKEGFGLKRSDR